MKDETTMPLASGTPRVRPRSQTAPPSLGAGARVGRYTIVDAIGGGGFGEVYAAHDPELDRMIALKLLNADRAAGGPIAEARLLREAKSIAKVSHPNVVIVHDTGLFEGRVFVAMELVDGVTLKEWLA